MFLVVQSRPLKQVAGDPLGLAPLFVHQFLVLLSLLKTRKFLPSWLGIALHIR